MKTNVYNYILNQETAYTKSITLTDGWDWGMKDFLKRCFLYKNSQFKEENSNRELRPNKNIILAIRNLQNRTEGFDVKDVELYVDNSDEYYKSLIIKKFHDKWAIDNQIDALIDDGVDSYGDYGGMLLRKKKGRPEVIDLRSLAFCNQTNLLAHPFAIKHLLSFSDLREMADNLGWGEEKNGANVNIEDLIAIVEQQDEKEVEVYELHGVLPSEWLEEIGEEGEIKDTRQIQIIAYYQDQNKNDIGITLFRKKMPVSPFKFLARDKIYDRALGRSGIEELIEAQKWTNWNEIKITEMLEAASKIIPWTNDPTIAAKHPQGLKGMDNLELLELQTGSSIGVVDNVPRNLVVFNDAVKRWEEHAQILGAASESLLGETPPSGTPFKLYEAQQIEGKSMHRFRQGQIAAFFQEVYEDWILPQMAEELTRNQSFLTEFSVEELAEISDRIMVNQSNDRIKRLILGGQIVDPNDIPAMQETMKGEFLKGGRKRFIKILKDDFKDITDCIRINIVNKQKNLALLTDKLVNVLRQYIATPQIRQDPEMTKLLNQILESSGMSPIMFGTSAPEMPQQSAMAGAPQMAMGQPAQSNQMMA